MSQTKDELVLLDCIVSALADASRVLEDSVNDCLGPDRYEYSLAVVRKLTDGLNAYFGEREYPPHKWQRVADEAIKVVTT